jgi:hypothetical protein
MSGIDIPRFASDPKAPKARAEARAPKPSLADAPRSVFDMGRRIEAEVGGAPAEGPPAPAPAAATFWGPQEQAEFDQRQQARRTAPTVIFSKTPLFALRSDNSLSLHLDGWDGPCVVLSQDITRALFKFLDRLQGLNAPEAS